MAYKNEVDKQIAADQFKEELAGKWHYQEFDIIRSSPYNLLMIIYSNSPEKLLPANLRGHFTDVEVAKTAIKSYKETTEANASKEPTS